jgi:hypothetical protein
MKSSLLLKIAAVLWMIRWFVHIFAGWMTIAKVNSWDTAGAISGIADKVDANIIAMDYPDAAWAILGQHGFNLFWIGIVTFLCAFYIWKGNKHAVYLAAITWWLADI